MKYHSKSVFIYAAQFTFPYSYSDFHNFLSFFLQNTLENQSSKVKVKVKLFLCLTQHHTMKMYGETGGIAPHILDLSTRWR
jgi:hypothetical protein